MRKIIRIGTRKSLLATTQSGMVRDLIHKQHPDVQVEMVHIVTKGDKILDVPLAKVGGKGLFVKELEEALLDGRVDLAVHSMKDVPAELPEGLTLAIIPERENPFDAFVSNRFASLEEMPAKSTVGTSSLRRQAQIMAVRPDLTIDSLRGNLDTRLKKLDQGDYDAIILAAAGLNRLGLGERITSLFSPETMLPAVAQGALGLETRDNDQELLEGLAFLDHLPTRRAVEAERGFLLTLEGGCQVPIAGHATCDNNTIHLTGLVASVDGTQVIREEKNGPEDTAAHLGRGLAETVLAKGGGEILAQVYTSC